MLVARHPLHPVDHVEGVAFDARATQELGQVAQSLGVGQAGPGVAAGHHPGPFVPGERGGVPGGAAGTGWRGRAQALEKGGVAGRHHHVEPVQCRCRPCCLHAGRRPVAGPVVEAHEVEQEGGPEVGHAGGRELVERRLHRPDGGRHVAGGGQHAGAHGGDAGLEAGDVEAVGAGHEVVAGDRRRVEVTDAQLDVDQHGEQFGGSQPVVTHRPQAPDRRGPGQVVVTPSQVEPGGGQQGLEVTLLAQQQHLGVGQAALADAQLGQGDGRVPARHVHDVLELADRLHQ